MLYRIALALILGVSLASPASAQAGVFADAFGLSSVQTSTPPGSEPSLAPLGVAGTAFGVGASLTVLFPSGWSIGGEWSVPARITSTADVTYVTRYRIENRYYEPILSVLVRYRALRGSRAGIDVGGGASVAWQNTIQRRADAIGTFPFFGGFGPFGPSTEYTSATLALTMAADLPITLSTHLALVPAMRVHVVSRPSDSQAPLWYLGVDSWVYRPSVGVRVTF
jgi:hypothetical protein